MKSYRVNDIFYSLQGEGYHTGRAAAFVRFSGCNLRCAFCDTDFASSTPMTAGEIVDRVSAFPARFVVLTGGEPTLQVDETLLRQLHEAGFEVAMETKGTHPVPQGVDWVTVSPKGKTVVERCNELKVVFTGEPPSDSGIKADSYFLQPCDTGDAVRNQQLIDACVDYIRQHPRWRLSLQVHKLAGFK